MKYLNHSSAAFGYSVDVVGVGKNFHYLNKIRWLNEYLQRKNNDGGGDDDIVIFTDAYDTFFYEQGGNIDG